MPFGSAAHTLHHGRSFGADALIDRLGQTFAVLLHNRQQFFHVGRGKDSWRDEPRDQKNSENIPFNIFLCFL